MKIPCNLGVTGHVYRSEEIYVCQCAVKDQRFNADVDNLGGGTKSVNNLIIGTIYGWSADGQKKKNVGILQLVNKNNEEPITDYDRVSQW